MINLGQTGDPDYDLLNGKLIFDNIVDLIPVYCPVQQDIDALRCKGALFSSQVQDIEPVIGEDNMQRAINPTTPEDVELKERLQPACAWFTYWRLARDYNSSYTDGGLHNDANIKNDKAKFEGSEAYGTAKAFLDKVINWLTEQGDTTQLNETPSIKTRVVVASNGRWGCYSGPNGYKY